MVIHFLQTIYIPGDNDVGGEGRDFIAQWKVDRYQKHFGNITDLQKFGFIDYVKVTTDPRLFVN